jgi:hypothetical protein
LNGAAIESELGRGTGLPQNWAVMAIRAAVAENNESLILKT